MNNIFVFAVSAIKQPTSNFGLPDFGKDGLLGLFATITNGLLGMIATFSVLFIIIGGFQYVLAMGNDELAEKGKKSITWAIRGLVIAILAWSIIAILTLAEPFRTSDAHLVTINDTICGDDRKVASGDLTARSGDLMQWKNTDADVTMVIVVKLDTLYTSGPIRPGGQFETTLGYKSGLTSITYGCYSLEDIVDFGSLPNTLPNTVTIEE